MTLSDAVTIAAILFAPLLAVQAQKWLEKYRASRDRQIWVFKTLRATRATGLSQDHVQALNVIDLEFRGKKFGKVREAWKIYLDHLTDYPKGEDVENRLPTWTEKKADLLATLLMEMGEPLGYQFDAVHIRKGIYFPEGHAKLETQQALIREGALRLLYGDSSIKMDVNSFPVDEEALAKQKDLFENLNSALDNNSKGLPVFIRNDGPNVD